MLVLTTTLNGGAPIIGGKKTYIGKRLGDKATNCASLLRIHTAFSLPDFYFWFALCKHGQKMGLAKKIKS